MIPTIGPARRTQRRRYPPTPVTPALPLNTGVQSPAAPQRARKAPGAPSRHPSPLRYPGGRARMARILARIWDGIPLRPGAPDLEVWIEPFAGGAGAALALLEAGVVDEVRLIEANPAIAALWRIILDEPDRLAAHVERHTPTTASFYASREQISALLAAGGPSRDPWRDAWAALVMNRCSYSGLVTGNVGPLGGRRQNGRHRVGDRWNGPALADRIRRVGALAPRIALHDGDALEYLEDLPASGIGAEAMVFADPPYVDAGPSLYPRSLTTRDHARLAAALRSLDGPWLATYDDHPAVHDLYRGCRIETPTERGRTGAEVIITPAWLPAGAVRAQPRQTTIYDFLRTSPSTEGDRTP